MIEHLIAKNAWKPILSVESEDGPAWKKMHKICLERLSKISIKQSKNITDKYCVEYLSNYQKITSVEIAKLTFCIFFDLLFSKRPNNDLIELSYQASCEWKKCIAIKGIKDDIIVNKFIKEMQKFLNTEDIYEISAILQPFIISPQINIPDIMVQWKKNPNNSLNEILASAHPFPILERYLDGIQYIHWMLPNKKKTLNWGIGPRKCLGMALANSILERILWHFNKNYNKIYPEIEHMYSGRNNDNNFNIIEIYYQLSFFIRIFLELLINKMKTKIRLS